MFSEDMFGYSTVRSRPSRGGGGSGGSAGNNCLGSMEGAERDRNAESGGADRESSMFRWRDRHYFGPRRWLVLLVRDTWYERNPEGIKTVAHVPGIKLLEPTAQHFSEFHDEKIVSLNTCPLYAAVRLKSGAMWWGVLPPGQRRKLWNKYRATAKKSQTSSVAQVCVRRSPMNQAGAIGFSTMENGAPKVGQLIQGSAWSWTDTCRLHFVHGPPPLVRLAPPLPPRGSDSKRSSGISVNNTNAGAGASCTSGSSYTAADSANKSAVNAREFVVVEKPDMTPTPSPASCTCSETGSVAGDSSKKNKRPAPRSDEDKRGDEEELVLKDVKNVLVGRVRKVDGAYAAVRVSANKDYCGKEAKDLVNSASSGNKDTASFLQDCRLLRKNELQVVKSDSSTRISDCLQRPPRRVTLADPGLILAFAVDGQGIHTINRISSSQLKYSIYNWITGKAEYESNIPTDSGSSIMGTNPGHNIGLHNTGDGDSIILLRDGNGTIYPFLRDWLDSIRDPYWPDLPPTRCIEMGSHSLSGIEVVRHILGGLESSQLTSIQIINKRCYGGRNIMHACISTCTSNKDADVQEDRYSLTSVASSTGGDPGIVADLMDSLPVGLPSSSASSSRAVSLREMMRQAAVVRPSVDSGPVGHIEGAVFGSGGSNVALLEEGISIPTLNWPPEPLALTESSSSHGDEDGAGASNASGVVTGALKVTTSAAISDPVERRTNALAALKAITECPALHSHYHHYFSGRDIKGLSLFMQTVAVRAYAAALTLSDVATKLARLHGGPDGESQKKMLQTFIFPLGKLGCTPDDFPLHVLCSNDTCSFTWTGAEHINQDIFEFCTCGLTASSLCCCTECALICHKGQDCKLKRTSPTAYCDCWEICKALIVGRKKPRFEHDLEPPRFARIDLERLLSDWYSVKAILLSGPNKEEASGSTTILNQVNEDQQYRQSQGGTTLLDKFTHCIMVNCSMEILDILLTTLITEMDNKAWWNRQQETRLAALRFVRSVVPVFVVFSVEIASQSGKKKGALSSSSSASLASQPLMICKRVFQALTSLAIEEQAADALIVPVRLGVARPTIPFPFVTSNADAVHGSEELFSVDPLQPLTPRAADEEPLTSDHDESSSLPAMSSSGGGGGSSGPDVGTHHAGRSSPRRMESEDFDLIEGDEGEREGDADVDNSTHDDGEGNGHSSGRDVVNVRSDTDMELDLLAKSESESDDNEHNHASDNQSTHTQDNNSVKRRVETGATSFSDAAMASLADESGDSTGQEEEESVGGETNEQDTEEFAFSAKQLERRNNSTTAAVPATPAAPVQGSSSGLAPQSMMWAIPHRENNAFRSGAASGGAVYSGSGTVSSSATKFMYLEPSSLRQSAISAALSVVPEPFSMDTTASGLARAFGLVVRRIADLLTTLLDYPALAPALSRNLVINNQESIQLQQFLQFQLEVVWDWLVNVMDSTEAQLRFGVFLFNASVPSGTPSNYTTIFGRTPLLRIVTISSAIPTARAPGSMTSAASGLAGTLAAVGTYSDARRGAHIGGKRSRDAHGPRTCRREFLNYCLFLMRSHNGEHADTVIDVASGNESNPYGDKANTNDCMSDMFNELDEHEHGDLEEEGASNVDVEPNLTGEVDRKFQCSETSILPPLRLYFVSRLS